MCWGEQQSGARFCEDIDEHDVNVVVSSMDPFSAMPEFICQCLRVKCGVFPHRELSCATATEIAGNVRLDRPTKLVEMSENRMTSIADMQLKALIDAKPPTAFPTHASDDDTDDDGIGIATHTITVHPRQRPKHETRIEMLSEGGILSEGEGRVERRGVVLPGGEEKVTVKSLHAQMVAAKHHGPAGLLGMDKSA
jgi:hypothetical protein